MSEKMVFNRFLYIKGSKTQDDALRFTGPPYNRALPTDDGSWALMRPSDVNYNEVCCDRCGTVYGFRPLIVNRNPEKILCDNCYVLETGRDYPFVEGEKGDGSDSAGTAL